MWHCLVLVGYRCVQDVRVGRCKVRRTWHPPSKIQDIREWDLQGWSERRERQFLDQVAFSEGHRRWYCQEF